MANAEAANAFEVHRELNKINKPVDKMEWGMTPPTINAYNDPQNNTINFPAGILQLPFFSATQSDAANYGAIGATIGHEMTHGFDDQGRKFDAKGNLRDWWTAADAKAYEERGDCLAAEYTHAGSGAGRRGEDQRQADPGRGYGRQRRHPPGHDGAGEPVQGARQVAGCAGGRWPDCAPALLRQLCIQLVRECASGCGADADHDRSALAGPLPGEYPC